MTSCCDRMNVRRMLLNPGDYLARRFDAGYARFVARMKHKTRKGDRRLILYSCLAYVELALSLAEYYRLCVTKLSKASAFK